MIKVTEITNSRHRFSEVTKEDLSGPCWLHTSRSYDHSR
jgi:hypothetical protein